MLGSWLCISIAVYAINIAVMPPETLQQTDTQSSTNLAGAMTAEPMLVAQPEPWLTLDRLLELAFRAGFASIFLINAVNAVVDPDSFKKLLAANILVPQALPLDALVQVAAVNDLLLGIFLLTQWKRKWVYAWAGVWLLIVASVKAGHFLS